MSMADVEQFLDRIGSVSIDFKIGEISWYPDPGTVSIFSITISIQF
jgi:hypothetical protein